VGSPVIVTVGISPAWDITCRVDGVSWGDHKPMVSQQCRPAGKALNICRALAWMGSGSIAAGLWGGDDYEQMRRALGALRQRIDVRMTVVEGQTRRNVTIVDTRNARQMHLRAESTLAGVESLQLLADDLERFAGKESVCVFAGAMPAGRLLDDTIAMIDKLGRRGAGIVVDSSGTALRRIVDLGDIEIIKPNLHELSELVGYAVTDNTEAVAAAAGSLCDRVRTVLVSRGGKGAVVVDAGGVLSGVVRGAQEAAVNTVGCGDYLLAGFVRGLVEAGGCRRRALEEALKAATARAWGRHDKMEWSEARKKIEVEIT